MPFHANAVSLEEMFIRPKTDFMTLFFVTFCRIPKGFVCMPNKNKPINESASLPICLKKVIHSTAFNE